MPITLTLHSFKEKQPNHNDEIVFFKRSHGFFEEFSPSESTVEYCWFSLDDSGDLSFDQCGFDPESESHHKLGDITKSDLDDSKWVLHAMVDGYVMHEDYFWMLSEDYHNALPYKD